jgi:hypothetical protein
MPPLPAFANPETTFPKGVRFATALAVCTLYLAAIVAVARRTRIPDTTPFDIYGFHFHGVNSTPRRKK